MNYYTFIISPEGEVVSMTRMKVAQDRLIDKPYVFVDSTGKKVIGLFNDEERGKPKFIHYINQFIHDAKI